MRSVSVDLNHDASLLIDIPDALCERDKVKFTVHTKVKKPTQNFQPFEYSIWVFAVSLIIHFFLNAIKLLFVSPDHP